jgi:hypothetical protein
MRSRRRMKLPGAMLRGSRPRRAEVAFASRSAGLRARPAGGMRDALLAVTCLDEGLTRLSAP